MRSRVEARDWWTSHKQFLNYAAWGFLPEPIDGKWPAETVERIVQIHEVGEECRPMCRRVFRLRSKGIGIWAPPAKLRRALSDLAALKSFTARKRKLNVINRAFEQINARLAYQRAAEPHAWMNYRPYRPKRAWIDPPPVDWRGLIMEDAVSDDHVRDVIAENFHWDGIWRLRFPDVWPDDLRIAVEERIVILVVKQLRIERGWRRSPLRIQVNSKQK